MLGMRHGRRARRVESCRFEALRREGRYVQVRVVVKKGIDTARLTPVAIEGGTGARVDFVFETPAPAAAKPGAKGTPAPAPAAPPEPATP